MLCGTLLSMLASTQHFGDSSIAAVDKTPSDVIVFWFGQEWYEDGMDAKEYADRGIKRWFFGGPALDAECQKFVPLIRSAGDGSLRGEAWDDVPGLIARLVLLDQLSRNAFRGTSEAFAYDNAAQQVSVQPKFNVPQGLADYYRTEMTDRDDGLNTVLVEARSIADLKKAFPNYFGDVRMFADNLRRIIRGEDAKEFNMPLPKRVPQPEVQIMDPSYLRRTGPRRG